jgi:hypothetical protein
MDKELLELAAKAAGYEGTVEEYSSGYVEMSLSNHFNRQGSNVWKPLTDDGDALRLAVDTGIDVLQAPAFKECHAQFYLSGFVLAQHTVEAWGECKHKATRRAIVRAAAEIGNQ